MNILSIASLIFCIIGGTVKQIIPRLGYDVSGMLLGTGNIATLAGAGLAVFCLALRDQK